MPFKKAEKPRSRMLLIRVTDEEHKQAHQLAHEAGLPLSTFGRRRILGQRVASHEYLQLTAAVNRGIGLLKHAFNETGGIHGSDLLAAIDHLRTLKHRAYDDEAARAALDMAAAFEYEE